MRMELSNAWNKFIYYRLWSPVYNPLFDRLFVRNARRRSMDVLDLKSGERALIPGVGKGAALPLLPEGMQAVGVGLSAQMLVQARRKLPLAGREIELREGDVQIRQVDPLLFDAAVLHLIPGLASDGAACFRGTMRALGPGGRAVIFDKFRTEGEGLPAGRRLLNVFPRLLGADITRRLGELIPALRGQADGAPVADPAQRAVTARRRAYRIVLVEKTLCADRGGL
jgi:phosphatidylethanolamine/phosphatidyl-N-methylethanolamine N-methyltransferase